MKKLHANQYPFFRPAAEEKQYVTKQLKRLGERGDIRLSPKFIKAFLDKVHRQKLPRGTIFCEQGRRLDALYFLIEGDIVAYRNTHGDLPVLWIQRRGDFVTPNGSISTGRAHCYAEMHSEGVVLTMSIQDFKKLGRKYPEIWQLAAVWFETMRIQEQDRAQVVNSNMPAIDRICWLLDRWEDAMLTFNNKVAGSYIGISADWYSKCKQEALDRFDKTRRDR